MAFVFLSPKATIFWIGCQKVDHHDWFSRWTDDEEFANGYIIILCERNAYYTVSPALRVRTRYRAKTDKIKINITAIHQITLTFDDEDYYNTPSLPVIYILYSVVGTPCIYWFKLKKRIEYLLRFIF